MNIPLSLHRQLILISGSSTQCLQSAHHFTTAVKTLWLSNEKVKGQTTIAISKATTVLGQEYQAVIFNAHTDKGVFDVNAFGAVVGTLMGGGTFILLTPTVSKWANHSFFLQRFIRLLKQFAIPLYTTQQPLIPAAVVNLAPSTHHDSHEQQDAFNAMLRVIQGHRRRPFVLTSDRGRGKSTLLGKFAAYLLHQGKRHIIVTAPSKKIAEPLFNAARTELEVLKSSASAMKGLHFLSPDVLHQQKPTADIVLVDEAASIPLPLLADFVKQHSRLIFATTEHGYEGCGRGFAIRFRSLLTRLTPHWKSAHLEHPFRWQKNDPLEKFSFDALLLNADIA
ncbi:MAG: DUF1726 domain-containing protein, partial [Cocleimonas sp.]|nr:DUF1726 domain-containing protein [Cocleimonas sp.]